MLLLGLGIALELLLKYLVSRPASPIFSVVLFKPGFTMFAWWSSN